MSCGSVWRRHRVVVVDKWVAVAIAGEHLEEPNQLATKGAEALYHRRVEAAVAAARKRDVLVVLALFLCLQRQQHQSA